MAVVVRRDLDDVAAGFAGWLAARGAADPVVVRCERASGGLSSDTLMVDVRATPDAPVDARVVRLAPAGPGVFPEYDLAAQARAQEVAAAHGVPTAVPVDLETDPAWLGAPFMVMPAIDGRVPGGSALHDPWIVDAPVADQARTFDAVLGVLAAVHRIGPDDVGRDGVIAVRDVDAELATWARYLDWYGDGAVLVPALVAALDWCRAHRPRVEPPPALLWGDVRLGNVIFDADRVPIAVLDWEMTTVGAPEHDVAWFLALEGTQSELFGATVPGFPDRATAIATYEAQAGRTLVDLDWFEVFALVRSVAILTRLSFLREQAGKPPLMPLTDNPMLGMLERRLVAAER